MPGWNFIKQEHINKMRRKPQGEHIDSSTTQVAFDGNVEIGQCVNEEYVGNQRGCSRPRQGTRPRG